MSKKSVMSRSRGSGRRMRQRWYLVNDADERSTRVVTARMLWPPKADRSLIPSGDRLDLATRALAEAASDPERELPGMPEEQLDCHFITLDGTHLLCWSHDLLRSIAYRREWYPVTEREGE